MYCTARHGKEGRKGEEMWGGTARVALVTLSWAIN